MTHTSRYIPAVAMKWNILLAYTVFALCVLMMHLHDQWYQKKRRKVERYSEVKTTSAKTTDPVLLEVLFLACCVIYIFRFSISFNHSWVSHLSILSLCGIGREMRLSPPHGPHLLLRLNQQDVEGTFSCFPTLQFLGTEKGINYKGRLWW